MFLTWKDKNKSNYEGIDKTFVSFDRKDLKYEEIMKNYYIEFNYINQ